MNAIYIDHQQCNRISQVLASLHPRVNYYGREFLNLPVERETQFRAITFSVAICHQTYNLYHPVYQLYGWDYLENVFIDLAKRKSGLIDPEFIVNNSTEKIRELLSREFSHDRTPENCTLDRLDERISIMKEISNHVMTNFGGNFEKWIGSFENLLVNFKEGFYEKMKELETFSDPLQKKLTFLLKLLEEASLIKIKDPENFIPIMDYHMQRVMLRMGCVEIADKFLKSRIMAREPLSGDMGIRDACVDAFRYIAEKSGHPVTKLNDFFWSLGRSCCHEKTLCRSGTCEKTPCTFETIIHLESHNNCPFQAGCKAFTLDEYLALWQPVVETHFY